MKERVAVLVIQASMVVEVLGTPKDLPLSWADGMVGVIPVFDCEESASKYISDCKYENIKILSMSVEPLTERSEG